MSDPLVWLVVVWVLIGGDGLPQIEVMRSQTSSMAWCELYAKSLKRDGAAVFCLDPNSPFAKAPK